MKKPYIFTIIFTFQRLLGSTYRATSKQNGIHRFPHGCWHAFSPQSAKKPRRRVNHLTPLMGCVEIRELFRSAPDVTESNKGFCLSSSCVCRRKKVLILMTCCWGCWCGNPVVTSSQDQFHGITRPPGADKVEICSFARCCVALLHPSPSSTAPVSAYSLTYDTWIMLELSETFNHSHLESVWS